KRLTDFRANGNWYYTDVEISYQIWLQDKLPVMLNSSACHMRVTEMGDRYYGVFLYSTEFLESIQNISFECWKKGRKVYIRTLGSEAEPSVLQYKKGMLAGTFKPT